MRKPVAVVDNESVTKTNKVKVLKRFRSIKEAEEWVGDRPDKVKLARGGYGIDAPEEMVNPGRR
jgi:hypothetical protein